jgi:hypothetical protein
MGNCPIGTQEKRRQTMIESLVPDAGYLQINERLIQKICIMYVSKRSTVAICFLAIAIFEHIRHKFCRTLSQFAAGGTIERVRQYLNCNRDD